MSILSFADNASTTLASAITNTATSLTLASGSGSIFPTASVASNTSFLITLTDSATRLIREICLVTDRTGDVLTVSRGQESTTPANWSTGSIIENRWTAGSARAMLQQTQYQIQSANYFADTGSAGGLGVVGSLSPSITNYSQILGASVRVFVQNTNSGSGYSANINGLGSVPIYGADGSSPAQGMIKALSIIEIVYNGTFFSIMNQVRYSGFTGKGVFGPGSTNFTVPASIYFIAIKACAAGGGGGAGGGTNGGGGGGGGGGSNKGIYPVLPGDIINVNCPTISAPSSTGGDLIITNTTHSVTLVHCVGGQTGSPGSTGGAGVGGNPGTCSVGTGELYSGQQGVGGEITSSINFGGAGGACCGFGSGYPGRQTFAGTGGNLMGESATLFGGGGSGAVGTGNGGYGGSGAAVFTF